MQQINPDNTNRLPPKWLVIVLLALPQVAETILAPALPDLARTWQLEAAQTQWVMGVFFLGFAVGVFLWGRLSDTWGRRPAMLAGLCLALAGTLISTIAPWYEILLTGRFLQALGLATCSVTTQTMLRDRLRGEALVGYFITLGIVLAWSPAVGPLAGQLTSDWHGYRAVLWTIIAGLTLLIALSVRHLPETRPHRTAHVPILRLAQRMTADPALRRAVVLVAGLNTLVFSFYAAGPFMVGSLPGLGFGWVGLAVALVGSLGAAWNRRLPDNIGPEQRIRYGLLSVFLGVVCQLVLVLQNDNPAALWAVAALPVFLGYGLSIPNILGPALRNYGECLGAAGALFGLAYYALLGTALTATSVLPFETPVPLALFWLGIAILLLLARQREKGLALNDSPRTTDQSSG